MFQGRGKSLAAPAALALMIFIGASVTLMTSFASADVQVCTPGPSAGKCTSPRGLATDFESGLLYVADNGNNRIDIFEESGTKPATPSSFGGVTAPVWIAVDNDPTSIAHHDIYVSTADFKVKKFEPNGTLVKEFGEQGDGTPEGCQIEHADDPIAVGPGGVVYLADSYNTTPGNSETTSIWANRVIKFDSEGSCIGAVTLFVETNRRVADFAVDAVGTVYVTVSGAGNWIRQYDGAGTLIKQFESLETRGLAVDAEDHLFAEQRGVRTTKSQLDHFLTEYDSAADGAVILRRFNYLPGAVDGSPGLAALHTTDGDLFASNESTGVAYLKQPPPGPVLFPEACHVKANAPGSVRATLQAEVNPEGKATTVKAEYLTQAQWEVGGFANPAVKTAEGSLAGGATDFELHEAALKVEPLEPETKYHCRFVATNADSAPGGTVGEEGSFETGPPFEFGPAWTGGVTQTAATIFAEGNPKGAAATGEIEYIPDAQYQVSGFAGALSAPTPPLDYGAGEKMVLGVGADEKPPTLTGLTPGTLYHYRLRAFNGTPPEGIVCPQEKPSCPELEHTFRTYGPEEAAPDNRGYELVSSGDTNSADLVGPRNTRGLVINYPIQIKASSPSGEAATYTSWTSFGETQGAPATSQYLSHRGASGWETENVSPGGFQPKIQIPPYLGFSADLRFGAFQATKTSLAAGCPSGPENLYLHEAEAGGTRCLTPEHANTANEFGYCFNYAGASEDGSRVFFQATAPYAGAPTGSGVSLYESHEGQIQVVSVLPGQSEPVLPAPNTSFGARNSEKCQNGQTILHNAISADGTRAIWTYAPTSGPSQLLDRINGSETVQLDKSQGGSGSGEGLYWAASKDGSVVYFTSSSRLLAGVKAEPGAPDLYRYDFSKSPESARLTDLTIKGTAPGNVKGVLGASEDGQVVYYVAGSALTPESEANEAGQHAEAGKNNLYRYDAGEKKNHFIARLSGEDFRDWETQPTFLTARVSADGGHLAFLSAEAEELAGYDNTLAGSEGKFAGSGHCRLEVLSDDILLGSTACPEAFVYDAQSGKLTCASCNPAGSRPLGPALLPSWSSMSEGPRVISDNGQRLFFESFDRLSDGDENAKRDVYEFEFAGSGTCTTSNPSFDPASGGCHFLVSSGRSPDESYLVDASADGRDAFFSTRARLVGWDTNDHYDVYDYREGGGFPEPPTPAPPCGGEAGCTPPATSPPAAPAPATPGFVGPGNPKPKPVKHKKKHHKKHAKKGKAKGKHHGAKKGRAGR